MEGCPQPRMIDFYREQPKGEPQMKTTARPEVFWVVPISAELKTFKTIQIADLYMVPSVGDYVRLEGPKSQMYAVAAVLWTHGTCDGSRSTRVDVHLLRDEEYPPVTRRGRLSL